MSIAAAYPRWPWFDLAAALVRNGRADPVMTPGVPIQSYLDLLYGAGKAVGQLAPSGGDPTADLTS